MVSDELFKKLVEGGKAAENKVVEWLKSRGNEVVAISPDYKPGKFKDVGDILVIQNKNLHSESDGVKTSTASGVVIEVKWHRDDPFTCWRDAKHKSFIVHNKCRVVDDNYMPDAFIAVNKPMTHIAVLPKVKHHLLYDKYIYTPLEGKKKVVICANSRDFYYYAI